MNTRTLVLLLAAALVGTSASAQEVGVGAGRFEIGAFPGGGVFFTKSPKSDEPDFGNYALGASFGVNVNRWVGFEGELGGGLGVKQTLAFNGSTFTGQKTPHMMGYTGNVIVNPAGSDRAVIPYAIGGIGGLTMFDTNNVANLGVTKNETFLTGNLGGGLKWYSNRHWGLRGDYRVIMVRNRDSAPNFFGHGENRYGHRVFGGLLLTY